LIDETEAIKRFDRPTNLDEVRRFLDITGYYRKFIEDYAKISQHLEMLLKKRINFFGEKSKNCHLTN
jgi:hypothetical protein